MNNIVRSQKWQRHHFRKTVTDSCNPVFFCGVQSFQLAQDFIDGMYPRPLTMFYEIGLLILEYHFSLSKRSKLRISMFAHNGLIEPSRALYTVYLPTMFCENR